MSKMCCRMSYALGLAEKYQTDLVELHFLIHRNKSITDSTSSCPLSVKLYSTLGGVSLYDFLSSTPLPSSSLSLAAKVLLLKPFKVFLNLIYLTGLVLQHRGIRISSVPFFVINFLNLAVSFISISASYPLKSHSCCCCSCCSS